MITYKTGDLFADITSYNHPVIIHIVNNIGLFGRGFVVTLGNRYPATKRAYLYYAKSWNYNIPQGQALLTAEKDCKIFNCVAQLGIKTEKNPVPFKAASLEQCLSTIAKSLFTNTTILMPRIGCGLAGGTWEIVEPIIAHYLGQFNVIVYTLPHEIHLF